MNTVFVVGSVLHTLPEGNDVWGVTSLDNLIYVLRCKTSQEISVYDIDSYRLLRRLNVPRLGRMSDMTVCAYNVCIYISGYNDNCVHRVALSSDDVTEWSVNDVALGLSVTDTYTVLVSCGEAQKIKEFTTNGKLLCQIKLPHEVMPPQHSIQLPSGEIIVSHGEPTDPVRGVCLIGSNGHVLKSYGGPGSQQINNNFMPIHLAVDRNGFVFVADFINCRVLLLSPDLTYIREVVSRQQLKWNPMRLFLDVDRRRLYVAVNECKDSEYTAGRVVVISV